jgi:hypothetical protein
MEKKNEEDIVRLSTKPLPPTKMPHLIKETSLIVVVRNKNVLD